MKSVFKIICFTFLGLVMLHPVNSQNVSVSELQVQTELEKRGISEAEMLQALAEKGIQVNSIDDLTPSQILELENIVKELEEKKSSTAANKETKVDEESFLDVPTTIETEVLKEKIENFVEEKEDEAGKPIYGHDFFRDKDLSVFETSSEVKAPDSYLLGSGDKIVVSIWGLSQAEFAFEIDREGYVEVDKKRIFLKGIELGEAKNKLENWFSKYYRFNKGEFEVSLSYSRTVNVNVQGEVKNPGGYTVSAINNAFNVLIAAEGPTRIGSLRDILLIKKGGQVINLDFYAYLKNPSNIVDASLEEGDILIIPVAKKLVEIKGGVKRPMVYELKNNENLGNLIELAGSYSQKAKDDFIQIERFDANNKTIVDVNRSQINNFKVEDGDVVVVGEIDADAENFVGIEGAIFNSGRIERFDGMKISDLLRIAKLKDSARRDLAFIKRTNLDGGVIYINLNIEPGSADLNIPLTNGDEINVFELARFKDNQKISVSGAVRNPGAFTYEVGQAIKIREAIELSGGLRRDASGYAIIHTIDPLNPKVKKYKRVNLEEVYNGAGDTELSALDSLEVFSNFLFDEESSVKISGAVNEPGTFQFGKGMVLGDVLAMSGGFQLGAATNRVEVSRLLIEENVPTKTVIANLELGREIMGDDENLKFEIHPYDEIMVRYVPEFEFQNVVEITGEVKFPGEYSLIKNNETIKDIIFRAGGLNEEAFPSAARLFRTEDSLGYVILKLDEVLKSSGSKFNFILKDKDKIYIPKSKDFVSISGATNARELYSEEIIGSQNRLNVPFHEGKNAKFYLEQYAGGISKDGNANDVFVEKANGEIAKSKNYFFYKSYPKVDVGSKIVVGYKPPKSQDDKEREDVDWTKVLNDAVAQAVSVLTLILLVERI